MRGRTLFWLSFIIMLVISTTPVSIAFSPSEVTVCVDPPLITKNPEEYFTINITISNVIDLYAWGFKLRWKTGLLECKKGDIIEGPFLKQGGTTVFAKEAYLDYIDVGCTLLMTSEGVSGSGTLASVTFKVLKTGNCTLDLYDVTLLDSNLQVIEDWNEKDSPDDSIFYTTFPVASYMYSPHPTEEYGRPIVGETVTFNATTSYDPDQSYRGQTGVGIDLYEWDFDGDGTYDCNITDPYATHVYDTAGSYRVTLRVTDDDGETSTVDHPIIGLEVRVMQHDIAVIGIELMETWVSPGDTVSIHITVLNEGSDSEHLNVTVYYDGTTIQTKLFDYWIYDQHLYSLESGRNATTTVIWDTTGVPLGNHIISVEAYLVHMVEGRWEHALGIELDLADNTFIDGTVKVATKPISIYTDKYTYYMDDTMHIGLNVTNPLDRPITVCIVIWLENPDGSIILGLHAHAVTLPAGFTYGNPSFRSFVVPPVGPGIYTWHAALLNPATHRILIKDRAEWQFRHPV